MPIAINRSTGRPRFRYAMLNDEGQEVDDDGNVIGDKVVRDGGHVRVTMLMKDGAPPPTGAVYLTDSASIADRHAFVRAKLGAAAEGKPAEFLDAAYAVFAGQKPTPATTAAPAGPVPLSDAQRTIAARGVEMALADHAKRQGGQNRRDAYLAMCDGMSAVGSGKTPRGIEVAPAARPAGLTDAGLGRRQAAYADYKTRLADAWKGAA